MNLQLEQYDFMQQRKIAKLEADRARLVAALRDAQTALDAGLNSGDAVSAAQEMDDAALMLRALLAELGE